MNNANRMLNQNLNNNAFGMPNPNINNNAFGMTNPNMNQLTYNNIGNNMKNDEEKFSRGLKLDNEIYIIKIKKIKPSQISIICENKFDYLSLYRYSITLTYDEFCKLGRSFRLYDNIDEIYDTIKNLFKGVDFSFRNEFNLGNNNNLGYNNNIGNNYNNNWGNNSMNNMQVNMNQMSNIQMQGNNNMSNNLSNIPMQGNNNMSNNSLNFKDSSNIRLENSNNGSINLILKIPLLNKKYEEIKIEFKKENKDIKKQYEKLKNKFLKIKSIVFPGLEEKRTPNNQPMGMNNQQMNMNNQQMGMNFPQMNNNMPNQSNKPSAETILSQIRNEFVSFDEGTVN